MRVKARTDGGDFKAKAIAGTHTILIALECLDGRRKGLKGFAFVIDRVACGLRH